MDADYHVSADYHVDADFYFANSYFQRESFCETPVAEEEEGLQIDL